MMTKRTILMLAANPKGTQHLRLDEEYRRIEQAIERSRRRDDFNIVTKWAVTDDDLRRAVLEHHPEIVHFSGHGDGLGLEFENDDGYSLPITARALAGLFKLCSSHVRCVVLNACYSQFQAVAIAEHIEHVVGMSNAIGDAAAIKFSQGFYDGIVAGRDFEDAFELGRNALDLRGIAEHLTPVLLSRSTNLPGGHGQSSASFSSEHLDALYSEAASQAAETRGRDEWTPQDIEHIRSQVWRNVNNLGNSFASCPIDGFPMKITLNTFEFYDADIAAYCDRHEFTRIEKETDPLRPSFEGKEWADHHIKGMAEIFLKGYMVNCPVCGTIVRSTKDAGFVWLNCLRCGQHGEMRIR